MSDSSETVEEITPADPIEVKVIKEKEKPIEEEDDTQYLELKVTKEEIEEIDVE